MLVMVMAVIITTFDSSDSLHIVVISIEDDVFNRDVYSVSSD